MENDKTEAESFRNSFLLATPAMDDPRFRFSVIYIINHDSTGAMGLIVNKAQPGLLISDLLEQIGIDGPVRVADTAVLDGGPVDIDRGFVLHSSDYFKPDSSLIVSETLSLTSTKDVLESLVSDDHPEKVILAVGYAGWGPGQLEREISENSWLVTAADDQLLFSDDLSNKWAAALNDMGIDPSCLSQDGGEA